jgi:molybdopterin-guanine dinucleotide biosynthesis protein A
MPAAMPHDTIVSCSIIAGGQSTRFGSNKALAQWDSQRSVIGSVIESVSQVTDRIMIISGDTQAYRSFGLPVHPDLIPGHGPASGIHAALSLSQTDRVLILACDMPALSYRFLHYMLSVSSWAPVVVPESDTGPEPLHAIWHRSLIRVMEQFMAFGRTSLRDILQALPCRIITRGEIAANGLDPLSLRSANTPFALDWLRQKKLSSSA